MFTKYFTVKQINISALIVSFLGITFIAGCSDSLGDDNKGYTAVQLPIDTFRNNNNYSVYAPPIPKEFSFAGEKVPLDRIDIRESLDREIVTNTFWHSQTFMWIKRANRWFPLIEKLLQQNNVPDDFKYLCVIESGLDNVVSPAGAKGMWQFIPATGRDFNLEINETIDERYNIEKATMAACQFLKKAHKKFGSWTVAAAAYNMGSAGLSNKMDFQQQTSYYDVLVNNETSRYVFRILAAKQILTHTATYGFHYKVEDLYPPFKTRSITIDSTITNLVLFADRQHINIKTLQLLNPWLRLNTIPNNEGKTYTILLPDSEFNDKNSNILPQFQQ